MNLPKYTDSENLFTHKKLQILYISDIIMIKIIDKILK